MNIDDLLDHYPSDAVLEAVYLAGRLFSRPITLEELIRQLSPNVNDEARAKALEIIGQIILEAEQKLGRPLSQLSVEEKLPYVEELDRARSELARRSEVDDNETEESMRELRGISL
jgi:hypothetical protein